MASAKKTSAAGKKARSKKRKNRILSRILRILISLAMLGCAGYFLVELITLDILPHVYLLIGTVLVVFISLLIAWGCAVKSKRPISKFITLVLSLVLAVTFGLGGFYLSQTADLFNSVTSLANNTVYTLSIMTLKDGGAASVGALNGRIGVLNDGDIDANNNDMLASLRSQGASVEEVVYDSPYSLVDALYAHEVSAIALPEQYHADIQAAADAYNNYLQLTLLTQTIDTYHWEEPRDPDTINRADPVANVLTDSFTILISGNDSYGSLLPRSRSDVNMLVTVNPKTSTVLVTSIPRDTYVELTCSKNSSACANYAGQSDKLTHAGALGMATLENSLENYLDIEINYTVRINFSSLVNIIDSVGGIDIDVPEGLEVDKFYANGLEGVKAGTNHLDGERALSFARERNAYLDGDFQRVKNQQEVIRALIHKMMSPAMVIHYPAFIKALSTAFETNMPAQSIKSLVAMEILRFPNWNIISCSLNGETGMEFSALNNDYASVTLPDQSEVERVHQLIIDVEAGREVTVEERASAGSYNAIGQDTPIDPSDITPEQTQTPDISNGYESQGNWQTYDQQPDYYHQSSQESQENYSTGNNEAGQDEDNSEPWYTPAQ